MAHICQVHPYEAAEGLCRSCGGPFCADCLVYPFGPVKPPYCVPCAVTAGGVRKSARNRTVVVPKENKAKLKEWRKARKRDLASPPPDGVATWQKMDEADSADEEAAAAAMAAAEREALRLPPPEPETPTPPPGVNLAPPGPAGSDWRDEIEAPVATNFGPPGSSFDHSAVAEPDPDALGLGIGADAGFAPPAADARWVPTVTEDPLVAINGGSPDQDRYDTYAGPATERTDVEPTPFDSTPYDTYTGPAAEPGAVEPNLADPPGRETPFDPTPFESTTFEPTPFAPDLSTPSVVADLDPDPLAGAFALPDPAGAGPLTAFGLGGADLGGAPPGPDAAAFDPLPPPPAPADSQPFADLAAPTATAGDRLPPPPAPAAPASLDALPRSSDGPAEAPAMDWPAPVPAMAARTPSADDSAPAATARPDLAGIPRSAIRPATPTRIPAAKAEGKGNDAKAMLARIAALRSDKDD